MRRNGQAAGAFISFSIPNTVETMLSALIVIDLFIVVALHFGQRRVGWTVCKKHPFLASQSRSCRFSKRQKEKERKRKEEIDEREMEMEATR